MLKWALAFFVIATGTAMLGFTDISGTAALIAQFLFFVFFVLFIITMVFRAFHTHSSRYHRTRGVGSSRHSSR